MNINNKARFWTGVVMGSIEVLGFGIFGLTKIYWGWLTTRLATAILIISGVLMYNLIAFMLIRSGAKDKKE